MDIIPFDERFINAAKEFNRRMSDKGIDISFPESPVPVWLPYYPGCEIHQDYYIAVENSALYGGYILKYQNFSYSGKMVKSACLQLPFSEGIIDRKYAFLGVQLVRDALEKEPLQYALGIGSYDEPYARMLLKMGWKHCVVPFYFKVLNPASFFKNMKKLRENKKYKALFDIARWTYLPGLLLKVYQSSRSSAIKKEGLQYSTVTSFCAWADDIWNSCKDSFSMIAERNSSILNILYPVSKERFIKLKIERDGKAVGWAVVLATKVERHKYFGNMYLGSILDNLSLRGSENDVFHCATEYLKSRGVDLIITNQSDEKWGAAAKSAGYLSGPSNFIFFASKDVSELIEPFDNNKKFIFFNRGDGDEPRKL